MADIRLPTYHSQWDGDGKGMKGLCAEACLKMADTYYTGREIPLFEIVNNGDGDGTVTSEDGAIKAANWLGLQPRPYFWTDINQEDLHEWLSAGNLVMAFINYGKLKPIYKQDQNFKGIHAILITGITDDLKSVRYADPNFWGARRYEGWYDNNKWISWEDLAESWGSSYRPFVGLQFLVVKGQPVPPTPSPTEPPVGCAELQDRYNQLQQKYEALLIEAEKYHVDNFSTDKLIQLVLDRLGVTINE